MHKYIQKLEERSKNGSLRSLSSFQGFTDFYSNDYLGIARSSVSEQQVHGGSTGSRLISGNSDQILSIERELAAFYKAEAGLIYNSGYDANLGFFSAVPQRGDTILYDQLIHASVRDGIRLSYAKSFSFAHNDLGELEAKLKKAEGSVFVAVESLYSMDGDLAPLKEIAALCQRYQALLVVDEAHSGGIFGNEGRGLTEELSLTDSVFARIVTFGKAYGTHGAIVLGDQQLIDFLINFSRSFIYTTALPPYQYSIIQKNVSSDKEQETDQLHKNISLFRNEMETRISYSDPRSPVQIILCPGNDSVSALAGTLQNSRIAVKPILSPTVPEGQERLRICLHAFNTTEEIKSLTQLLKSVLP